MKKMLGIVLSALMVSSAMAQITLNQGSVPTAGETLSNYSNSATVFDPSATGGNQNWDISDHPFSLDEYPTTYVSPAGTPFASEFPTATLATSQGDSSFTYMRVASNGFYLLGFASNVGGQEFIVQPDEEILVIPFPCTMNTAWSSVFRITTEIIPGFETVTVDSSRIEVQAWGTMTTPTWTESVLKALDHSTIRAYFNGQQQGETQELWSYTWFSGNASRSVNFHNDEDGSGPNYTSGTLDYTNAGTVDVPQPRGPVSESFKLSQNYPNPFNPTTSLPIQLDKPTKIQLTIYNEVGQVVYDHSLDLTAGQHSLPIDGSAWGSGSYFAKVMAGNEVQSTRMVLVK